MRFLTPFVAILALAGILIAQTPNFTPRMPDSVPAVQGAVAEPFVMRYIDVKVGDGAPAAAGKLYKVHYTGWLRDGTKFDSSRDRGEPLTFVQGQRQVIAGWETGFEGMRIGGQRRLFIPYQLGYGEKGSGRVIGPKAELIFDVELLDVSEPPALAVAVDLLAPLNEMEKQVTSLFSAVPDSKLDWRPGPGVRSFREVALHIAAANQLILGIANTQPKGDAMKKLLDDAGATEHRSLSREEILALLTESFAAIRKSLDSARPGPLAREAEFFGTPTTRRGVFTFLDTHIAEHLGQMIAYARVNGITPPWSQPADGK
jgi:uncharacterized damage-inducible protein DinB